MSIDKVAAAYLSYFAYNDEAADPVPQKSYRKLLSEVPIDSNGPWTLSWGPAAAEGILAYVAQGVDGTCATVFRGTETDVYAPGWLHDIIDDVEARPVEWNYPVAPDTGWQITNGLSDALATAIGLSDPISGVRLFDHIDGLAGSGALQLMVAGHSLGGALAVAATAWLQLGLAASGAKGFTLWPHTFAAPSCWNGVFADWFGTTFEYYAAVNSFDTVPMAWADIAGILATYPAPGPSLRDTDRLLYDVVKHTEDHAKGYSAVVASNAEVFAGKLTADSTWDKQAGDMHSMALQYFPTVVGGRPPPLPYPPTAVVLGPA